MRMILPWPIRMEALGYNRTNTTHIPLPNDALLLLNALLVPVVMEQSSASTAASPGTDFHGGRVLIPRLERPTPPTLVEKRPRVARACTNCRKRKIKCTGEQPRCRECESNNLPCVYEQHRKDRLKEVTEQKQYLVALLKDLLVNVNGTDKRKIQAALEAVDEDGQASAAPRITTPALNETRPPGAPIQDGEVEENQPIVGGTNTHSHMPVFDGTLNLREDDGDLDWLQNMQLELASAHEDSSPSKTYAKTNPLFNNDGFNIDNTLNVNELPSLDTAKQLYRNYSITVHKWLPILPNAFEDQFKMYYNGPYQVPDKWLAILNLVFAVGARYSRLIGESEGTGEVVYVLRAMRLLRVTDGDSITLAPDLPLVQALALLSFYHLITGQADRAWTTVGISVRSALALGLHLRKHPAHTSVLRKETSTRTWWSLHLLECLTSCITGRPCTVPLDDCNVSLPQALPEEELRHTTVSLLCAQIQISLVAHRALTVLHSVRAAITPWDRIQGAAAFLLAELEKRTPDISSFSSEREKLLLQFNSLSTRLTITRPFLHPREAQGDGHDGLPSIDSDLSELCVQTALDLSGLLPDEPNKSVYEDAPWWCLVHYLMQAIAVFLLDMSRGGSQPTGRTMQVADALKKLVQWLRLLQDTDVAAERAIGVVIGVLRKAPSQAEIADLLEEEAVSIYGGPLFVSGRLDVGVTSDMGLNYPQLPSTYGGQQLADLDGDLHLLPGPLPPPPMYGDPFLGGLDEQSLWSW